MLDVGIGRPLFLYLGAGLGRRARAPQLIEGVHVEGQAVEAVAVACHRAVGEAVEGSQAIDVPPHLAIARVEDVGTVGMHLYAVRVAAIDVAARVRATVHHQAPATGLAGFVGKDGTKEARAHNEVIVGSIHRCVSCKGMAAGGLAQP